VDLLEDGLLARDLVLGVGLHGHELVGHCDEERGGGGKG
jgi:hypothetical protein